MKQVHEYLDPGKEMKFENELGHRVWGGGGGRRAAQHRASLRAKGAQPTATAESQAASAAAEAMGWMPVCDSTGRSPRTLLSAALVGTRSEGGEGKSRRVDKEIWA